MYCCSYSQVLPIFIVLLVCWLCPETCSIPVDQRRNKQTSIDQTPNLGFAETMELLLRYGYLESDPTQTDPVDVNQDPRMEKWRLYTTHNASLTNPPKEYISGLRQFQQRYGLPVTGQLDRATATLLTSPRCGNPDRPIEKSTIPAFRSKFRVSTTLSHLKERQLRRTKRYLIGDEKMKWTKKKLTWQIRNYPSHSLSRVRTHAVFQHTFNLWSKVIDLDFVEEKDYSKSPDIEINFGAGKHGDSIPFDGPGGVLAHAFYPTPDNVYSFAGDAHFDDAETWNDGPHKENRNLVSVAAHELGHSLGLGHSAVPTAIMYPYYVSTWKRVQLDPDDIEGMQQIYGAAKPGKFIPPEPVLPDIPPPPPISTPTPEKGQVFDYCNISINAIIKIRNLEFYIFKGPWQWRITWSKTVTTWISYQFRDGPAKITYYWPALPKYVDYIDAGIEREDAAIYMFRGNRFWLLADNMRMKDEFPMEGLPLTELGLPSYVKSVDAVFLWNENHVMYLFSGNYYWRLDDKHGRYGQVSQGPDYPRRITDVWRGVPTPVDAAFTGLNGKTIFFKGTNHYVFDNVAMRVETGYPQPSTLGILGCLRNE